MKNYLATFKTIVIAVAMLGFSVGSMAQDIKLDDGAIMNMGGGTQPQTVTSTIGTNSSSAIFNISNAGDIATWLTGTYSGYYGAFNVLSGSTAIFQSASMPARITIGGAGYTGASTLNVEYPPTSFDATQNAITMDKYGILDVENDVTISTGGIQMNSYGIANAPQIKFHIGNVTQKIIFSASGKTILTDDPTTNRIDPENQLTFDMTNAPTNDPGVKHFIVASFLDTNPTLKNGTATLTNDDGNWESTSVNLNGNDLRLTATFAPLFQINSTGAYTGTLSGLSTRTTTLYQKLLKNKLLAATSYTVDNNLLIDLNAKTLSGDQNITISSGKILGLKGLGNFYQSINYSTSDATLMLVGTFTGGQMPTISASTPASGTVQIGDNSGTVSTFTIDGTARTHFNSKVSQVVVKNGATLTVTAP